MECPRPAERVEGRAPRGGLGPCNTCARPWPLSHSSWARRAALSRYPHPLGGSTNWKRNTGTAISKSGKRPHRLSASAGGTGTTGTAIATTTENAPTGPLHHKQIEPQACLQAAQQARAPERRCAGRTIRPRVLVHTGVRSGCLRSDRAERRFEVGSAPGEKVALPKPDLGASYACRIGMEHSQRRDARHEEEHQDEALRNAKGWLRSVGCQDVKRRNFQKGLDDHATRSISSEFGGRSMSADR